MADRVNHRGWTVIESIASDDATMCVDFFEDPAGGIGFELFRSDPEDAGTWTPIGGFASTRFPSPDEAATRAVASVSWLATHPGAKRSLDRWLAGHLEPGATDPIALRAWRPPRPGR